MPCGGHLALRVTGTKESERPFAAVIVESFVSLGEKPPAAIERIGLVAADREF
jgi:hypothetical protein